MQVFFEKTFYHNTIADWLIAIGIIAGAIILGKIIYWILGKFVKNRTKRTKTKLDDIIIDMFEEPIVLALVIAGIWYGMKTLNLPAGATDFMDKVFYILILINIAWLVNRLIDSLMQEYLVPLVQKTDNDLDDQLLPIVRKTLKVTVWIIAIIVGLNNAGYNVGALLAGLGIGGLALAMAAKDSVSNLFGGFTIFTDKPFTIHDRIQVKGFDGVVQEIGIRSTRIRTLDGRIVTIPNMVFASESITNVSSEPNRKVVLTLGLTYNTDEKGIDRALELLAAISKNNTDIEETALSSFSGFGDFSLNILFIYYIKKESDILATQTAINRAILKEFNAAGLEFAFPTQTIYNIPQHA